MEHKTKQVGKTRNRIRKNMHSFIADDDVERMLARLGPRGVMLTWYVNTALRKALIGDGHNRGLKGLEAAK